MRGAGVAVLEPILDRLEGWSKHILASAGNRSDRVADSIAVADALSVLIPLVRPELRPRPDEAPEPFAVVSLRILDILQAWTVAFNGDAHSRIKKERLVAVADVIRILVPLVRPVVEPPETGALLRPEEGVTHEQLREFAKLDFVWAADGRIYMRGLRSVNGDSSGGSPSPQTSLRGSGDGPSWRSRSKATLRLAMTGRCTSHGPCSRGLRKGALSTKGTSFCQRSPVTTRSALWRPCKHSA